MPGRPAAPDGGTSICRESHLASPGWMTDSGYESWGARRCRNLRTRTGRRRPVAAEGHIRTRRRKSAERRRSHRVACSASLNFFSRRRTWNRKLDQACFGFPGEGRAGAPCGSCCEELGCPVLPKSSSRWVGAVGRVVTRAGEGVRAFPGPRSGCGTAGSVYATALDAGWSCLYVRRLLLAVKREVT